MGTSRSALELGRKFDTLSREIEYRQAEAQRNAAKVVQRSVMTRLRAATGGDLMLSGMNATKAPTRSGKPRAKGKMGVRIAPERGGGGLLVAATGPVQLVESDVQKHIVTSRYSKGAGYTRTTKAGRVVKGRSTRESRAASVALGLGATGGGRRAVLHWGGNYARWTVASSKGREPWRKGVDAASVPAVKELRDPFAKSLVGTFR